MIGDARDRRLAWALLAPALLFVGAVALVPALWTVWESLHLHDLRMPWRGRPFVGLGNYAELASDARFRGALAHTLLFTGASVALELLLGLALALAVHRPMRGRAVARAAMLLPWAIPTVVAGLVWRFLFEPRAGAVAAALGAVGAGASGVVWLADATLAWVPLVLADVWKTTPFVALLLLAGLQGIDPELHEAAAVDGAGAWRRLAHITLPLLAPAILVVLVFRTLDALRVFDLVYVLTGGGPGTATEPLALYAYAALLEHLRFGYGAAIAVALVALAVLFAALYARLIGRARGEAR